MTTVLPLLAFWITKSLHRINSFKVLDSDSVKLVLTLSKLQDFKVEKQNPSAYFRVNHVSQTVN